MAPMQYNTAEIRADDIDEAIKKGDIVIVLMGPPGSGKSTFIDMLTSGADTGAALLANTTEVQGTRINNHPTYGSRLIFVDTPSFDVRRRRDLETLAMIAGWLRKTYENEVKLTGLLYLHPVASNRMTGSSLILLQIFGALCGDLAMKRVRLVTTMWQKLKLGDQAAGRKREEELKERFWKPMIEKGARCDSLPDKTQEHAWQIIERVLMDMRERQAQALLLQEELVHLRMQLNETQAGIVLYKSLKKLQAEQEHRLNEIVQKLDKSTNPGIRERLGWQEQELEEDLKNTLAQVRALKMTRRQRFKRFLSNKTVPQAHAVDLDFANEKLAEDKGGHAGRSKSGQSAFYSHLRRY